MKNHLAGIDNTAKPSYYHIQRNLKPLCKQTTAISSKLKTPQVGIPCSKQLNRLGTSQIAWCQGELDRSRRYSRRLAARASISPPVLSTAHLGLSPVINCALSKTCKGGQKQRNSTGKTHLKMPLNCSMQKTPP